LPKSTSITAAERWWSGAAKADVDARSAWTHGAGRSYSHGSNAISAGAGLDVVFADDGDDIVEVRDSTPDRADGGAGNDSVVADRADLDTVAGFETLERTPDATPPPVVTPPPVDTSTRPLIIRGGT
jgi:hypothetical protein